MNRVYDGQLYVGLDDFDPKFTQSRAWRLCGHPAEKQKYRVLDNTLCSTRLECTHCSIAPVDGVLSEPHYVNKFAHGGAVKTVPCDKFPREENENETIHPNSVEWDQVHNIFQIGPI